MPVIPATLTRPDAGPDSRPVQPLNAYQGRLEDVDYVEEEWFATGEEDGRPYTTVILVRRPREAANFSGTVVVEPLHAFPITPVFMYTGHYIMRSGHAWVSVGSQKTSVDSHYRGNDPERYAAVHIEADPPPPGMTFVDPPATAEDGVAWWTELDRQNRASQDILAQVGAAIGASAGPFEGFGVEHVLLVGHSYTGYLTTLFIREAHASKRLADGSPVFDGFFPSGWPTTPFEACDVPIVQVITEGDISAQNVLPYRTLYAGLAYRRPDSDEPGDRFRLYELPGVAHTSTQHPPIDDLKFLEQMLPPGTIPTDVEMSSMPFNELYQMALDHLIRWVAEGVAPPRADRLTDAPEGWFARDEHGNTRGGVRTAQLDVPRARHLASLPDADRKPAFGPYGFEQPFGPDLLGQLYADRVDYLERFGRRLDELVAQGWLLAEDAAGQRDEAAKADIP